MRIDAKVTISRLAGGSREYTDNPIQITVEDATSGVQFLELHIPLDAFAEALTGMGARPCWGEVRGVAKVGLQHEYKTETVLLPESLCTTRAGRQEHADGFRAAFAPHEVDGWTGRVYDAQNCKNELSGEGEPGFRAYRIGFDRWVPGGAGQAE